MTTQRTECWEKFRTKSAILQIIRNSANQIDGQKGDNSHYSSISRWFGVVVVVVSHATSPQRWADYAVEHSAVSWLSVMAWEGQSPVRNRAGPSVPAELIACLETRREHKVSGEIKIYQRIWEQRAFQFKRCCWLMVQFNFPTKGQTNSWIMEEVSSDKRCLEKKR